LPRAMKARLAAAARDVDIDRMPVFEHPKADV